MPNEAELIPGGSRGGFIRPPWKPGQSGNPSGKPKIYREVLELYREQTAKAVAVLVDAMSARDAGWPSRVVAAAQLLDRAWGKPREAGSESGSAAPHLDLSRLTDAEIETLTRIFSRMLPAPPGDGGAK